jgi:hypothetical protein
MFHWSPMLKTTPLLEISSMDFAHQENNFAFSRQINLFKDMAPVWFHPSESPVEFPEYYRNDRDG